MVVPYIGTWIETAENAGYGARLKVVPYIGTWIETLVPLLKTTEKFVVPYIGTWIETVYFLASDGGLMSYLI